MERVFAYVTGPSGVGKTAVALRIARGDGDEPLLLSRGELFDEEVETGKRGAWSPRLLTVRSLVLDGPTCLRERLGPLGLYVKLFEARRAAGLRTVVCEQDEDGSSLAVMGAVPMGCAAVVTLRFPASRNGRVRFAKREALRRRLLPEAARGLESIVPWTYGAVLDALDERQRTRPELRLVD